MHPRRRKHDVLVPDVDGNNEGRAKISMDYMYLSEKNKRNPEATNNPPHLVVLDHKHGKIWAHKVLHKSALGTTEWVPRKAVQDLHDNGMQHVTIHVKTNQKPAIVNVQTATQDLHPDRVKSINNAIGESKCNGHIDDGIRRVQEKVKVLRHQIESQLKHKVPDAASTMFG